MARCPEVPLANGVLNVAVPQVVLNEPCVCALISQSKAAGMTQHVGMHRHRQPSLLAELVQHQVVGRAVQGLAPLTEKNARPGAFRRMLSLEASQS